MPSFIPTQRLSGSALRALAIAVRNPAFRAVVSRITRKELGIDALSVLDARARGPLPLHARPTRARTSHARPSLELGALPTRGWPHTAASYAEAFRERRITPREVAERAFRGARSLAARTPSIGPFQTYDEAVALEQADAATQRIHAGQSRGLFDGVPLAIKEQTDMRGIATQVGTSWMPHVPAAADAPVVARLRASGAVLLGHTMMTEFGMTPTGANPHRVMPRNPYDAGRLAGGSSTGSGVAVATGICPAALGADGGGSIRTPAAMNGIFGIKPTFGRIPRTGDAFGGTMAHLGPLGASTRDLALFLEIVSGEDAHDDLTQGIPPVRDGSISAACGRGVRGIRIGVDEGEWADASPDIVRAGREALDALVKEGAILVPLKMKLAKHAPAIGYQTIGGEAYADFYEARLHAMDKMGADLQLTLQTLADGGAGDYLDAQKLRSALRREVADVLRDVDVIALPTTGCTAPRVTDEEARCFVDAPVLHQHCRFAFLGNLTGLPASSAPVGRDAQGMPIGLQILGDAFDEATVLQVTAHLERVEAARVERPLVHVDLLG